MTDEHVEVEQGSQPGGNEPDTGLTAIIGVVFAILLFVVVVFLQAYFYRQSAQEHERKVVAVAPEELSQLRTQQEEVLHDYRWVDENKGVVAIPIERAMTLVARDGGRVPWPEVQPPRTPAGAAAAKPAAPTGKK
jgi:hypothetical protein